MQSCSGQGESEGRKRGSFLRTARKKRRRITPGVQEPVCQNEGTDNGAEGMTAKTPDSRGASTPIREEKIEEAKKKKQNGDYDSQEVYQKIADRLMDLFGI
jgi:anti-sigma28 factor (negative regulator of flagellin synthesis)